MSYALDPRIHRVWRTPQVVQFGVERPLLTLTGVSNAEERLLVALDAGMTLPGLQLVARRAGGDDADVERFLDRLAPVLARRDPAEPVATATPVVVLDGVGATAARLAQILRESECDVRTGLEPDDPAIDEAQAAVLIASFAIRPDRHRRWLRRDTPHLPIVFGDSRATIGPFVEPGDGPCLGCVDRERVDADPDWPAMASQLFDRDAGRETSLVSGWLAAVAARSVHERVRRGPGPRTGLSVSLDYETGSTTLREHRPHAECGCRALPGTGTADAARPGRPDFPPATS